MKGKIPKILSVALALALVLSFSLVTAVPVAAATDRYVSTDGSDEFGNGTETWVDTDENGVWSTGDTGPWLTIQHAIDAAFDGDTIIVSDGTYNESISVTTSDLTLRSESGRDSTIIENVGNVGPPEAATCGFLIRGSANDFTLGGAADQGFTFSGGTSPRLIQLNNGPSGVEISYNKIDTTGDASTGILIGAAGATGLTVDKNIFIADEATSQDWPLIGPDTTNLVLDVTVTDNEFTGSGTPDKSGAAIALKNVSGTSTFNGNTISAFDRGIIIGGTTSDLDVSGNTISNCGKGVQFRTDTHAEMENNTFAGNTYNIYHAAEIVTGTGGSSFYGNIQDAIDSASAGDTINVAAGTYTPSDPTPDSDSTGELTINKEGLILKSTGDATETIIEAKVGNTGLILIAASDVTLDGFTIRGTSETDGATGCIYLNVGGTAGVTIENNIIEWTGDESTKAGILNMEGISVEATITHNTISGFWQNVALNPGFEATISNNIIKDSLNDGIWVGSDAGVTITGNTITNNDEGVCIGGDDVTVSDNDISDNVKGIKIYAGASLAITGNDITDNTAKGILIENWDASNAINFNNITGNTDCGIENTTATSVNAEKNWWGGAAGPITNPVTNPYNVEATVQGNNNVSDNVDYIPWMIHTELVSGWNIYSTPIALDSSCDTIAKALDIWTTADSMGTLDIAYYFDSEASPQAWSSDITSLTPLQAYYVKMEAASTIDVFFSTEATSPPQRVMYTGWNLVGPAELYDMDVDDALLDAYYGTGVAAELWGYSKVISPAVGQTYWTYLRDGETNYPFIPTKGYWVFMVNDGVLGGSTSTPISPQ